MSHADVVALLASAALVPGRLRALEAADTEEGAALRAHLADCEECRAELYAWQAVDEALVATTPETMTAPPAARSRILSSVVATGVARGPDRILGAPGPADASSGGSPVGGAVPPRPAVAPPGGHAGVGGSVPPAANEPPAAGRVWRSPSGAPLPSPMPAPLPLPGAPVSAAGAAPQPEPGGMSLADGPATADTPPATASARRRGMRALPGGKDGEGVGFRVFLAVAAAAVFLFVLGAALGGPLGLTAPATPVAPDTTARVELEKVLGRVSDLLELDGTVSAPLTDQAGLPAGAVLLGPAELNLLAIVTRSLPEPTDGVRYVCLLEREGERFEVGYMRFASDPDTEGHVAYWVGPLDESVPMDAGAPGDAVLVFREGETNGPPLLSTTF